MLLGRDEGTLRRVARALPVENASVEADADRYMISPEALHAAEAAAATEGLLVVGAYHSHPDGTARPSAFDQESAWPWYSYLIIPLSGSAPGPPRAWRLREDRSGFSEEDVLITETA